MTSSEKDRLIAEHLEPKPQRHPAMSHPYSDGRWWIEWNGEWQPRSMVEPEMTVLLLKALLKKGFVICGNKPWDGTGWCGVAIEHRESNGGDETNTYRTDDKIEEAIRDAYIEAFTLKPGT